MLYTVKGPIPSRPSKPPLRIRDLKQGELAVITEAGDNFGKCLLKVEANDGSGGWLVCLDDATIPSTSSVWDCLCCLVKPPDKITLLPKSKAAEIKP